MIDVKQQEELFIDIAKKLSRPITLYAIGGTAMLFLGLKENTLDIDLVFTDEKDRKAFQAAAMSLVGYEDFDAKIVYRESKNLPEMVKLPSSRLDLFLNQVITFHFSDAVKKRAVKTHQFDKNLIIKVSDPHDILLMKCATSRTKDEEDIESILKSEKINWDIILEEVQNQVNLGNETINIALGTRLEDLQNKNKSYVPKSALDKLWKMLNKQVKAKRKKPVK